MSLWIPPSRGNSLFSSLGQMTREMDRMERQMMRAFEPYWRNSDVSNVNQMVNSVGKVTNDATKFAVSLDVSSFHPEELKVETEGSDLVIEGKQRHESDHGFTEKCFTRRVRLPDDVDLTAVRSSLSNDGHLTIEAPKTGQAIEQRKSIPIEAAAPAPAPTTK